MLWFYADDSDQQHEVEENQLADLVSRGTIRPDTLVWNETMTEWKTCSVARPDLFSVSGGPPEFTSEQKRHIAATASAYGQAASPPPVTDAVAICALVFGVLGLICIQIFSPVAVICGHIALKRANESGVRSANKGLAIAGLVTGYLGILILLAIIVFYGFVFAAAIAEA